jgi:signal transduction histidine kinase
VDTTPRPPLLKRLPAGALAAVAVLLAAAITGTFVQRGETSFLQYVVVGVAVGFIAVTRRRRTSIPAAAITLGLWAAYAPDHGPYGIPSPIVPALLIAVAWIVGNSVRQRRDYADRLRAQATVQAVTAERLRIARELHDMVAHSVGIIAIQAGMGSRVMDTQPDEARKALRAIEATSRETLAGLRRTLGSLRQADPESASAPAPLEPAPGLADIGRLAARAADAGVRVDVQWRGEQRLLPAEVDLSAFRIIQESITNVVRHANIAHCQVSVDHREQELSIEIVDDGRGCALAGAGYGIVGMRERVGLLHGQFTAGPRPEGGFRVAAQLPVPAAAR